MNMLVEEKIYKKIIIYDYQGVCFKPDKEDDANSSSFLYTVSISYLSFFSPVFNKTIEELYCQNYILPIFF